MTGHRSRGGSEQGQVADVVAKLERWQQFGGTWRVLNCTADGVTISLCRCDGGEEHERIASADPSVISWLDGRIVSSP